MHHCIWDHVVSRGWKHSKDGWGNGNKLLVGLIDGDDTGVWKNGNSWYVNRGILDNTVS